MGVLKSTVLYKSANFPHSHVRGEGFEAQTVSVSTALQSEMPSPLVSSVTNGQLHPGAHQMQRKKKSC